MPSNVSVSISAEVVDLQTKFAIAKAESSALSSELNRLAKEAAATGGDLSTELKTKLTEVAEQTVSAKTKTADLNAELKAAQGSTASFGSAIADANAVLGPFGAALSAAAVISFGKSALEYAANIQHMADVLGLSTDDLQAFQFAARDSGVATEDADTMLRRFMSNLGGLREGAGPAVKAIEDLGISAKELGGPPADAIALIAKRLLDLPDPAERARIETELFGRSGADLNAMLAKAAAGFDDMKQKASDAGQMLGGDTTENAEKAENAINGLWAAIMGAAAGFANFVITQNPFIDEVTRSADAAKKLKEALPATAGGLGNEFEEPFLAAPDIAGMEEAYRKAQEASKRYAEQAKRDAEEIQKAYEDEVSASLADAQHELEGMQRADVQAVNDYVEESNRRLAAALAELDKEYQYHQITAQQKRDAEVALTQQIEGEALKRLNAEIATLSAITNRTQQQDNLLRQLEKQKTDLIIADNAKIQKSNDALIQEEMQKWSQLSTTIVGSMGSAFKGLIFQGQTWQQAMLTVTEGVFDGFLSMGEKWLENWIEQQIASEIITKTTDSTKAIGQITDQAAVAGATAYAQYAGIPPLAAAMAAEAVQSTMAFTSLVALDTGTNYVPQDMPAMLHQGEAVIPARFNPANGGGGGGVTYNIGTGYAPRITARDSLSIGELIRRDHNEFVSEIARLVRNGSLRF